ncbi:MAG TPA: hypothetical protein VG944_00295 [Fimbriimonas sp.]|nr:hypothetical protein [Fimbriimonas sp.]
MSPRLARALVRLYPQRWRGRYGAELELLLVEEGEGFGAVTDILRSALIQHLRALRFGSSGIVFGIGPTGALLLLYIVAGRMLWWGWRMFLPGEATPFVRLEGGAVFYFGIDRLLYYSAPVLIAWGVCCLAGKRHPGRWWPAIGMLPAALIAALIHVYAERVGQVERVRFGLVVPTQWSELQVVLLHAAGILFLSAIPYLARGIFAMEGRGRSLEPLR